MSVFVLGPFIDHDEPTPTVVVVPPTKVGIVFGTPATAPGGICNVILADTNADPAVCPTAVHVFFV
ncbi:MAG TPA: hypothetical protein VES58_06695, partial [Syntrophobacteria bacterium]|nr:hypothetical protein [Syntrophobacteria bacterium]